MSVAERIALAKRRQEEKQREMLKSIDPKALEAFKARARQE